MDMDPHYIMDVCAAIRAAYYYTKIYYISYTHALIYPCTHIPMHSHTHALTYPCTHIPMHTFRCHPHAQAPMSPGYCCYLSRSCEVKMINDAFAHQLTLLLLAQQITWPAELMRSGTIVITSADHVIWWRTIVLTLVTSASHMIGWGNKSPGWWHANTSSMMDRQVKFLKSSPAYLSSVTWQVDITRLGMCQKCVVFYQSGFLLVNYLVNNLGHHWPKSLE